MPLYEYQCDACGCRFELIQKFSDPPARTCPTCGGSVRKLMSSAAIQFKGSGWYITDYAKKDQTAKSDGSPADAAGAKDKGEKTGKTEKSEKSEKSEKNASPTAPSASPSSPATSSSSTKE